MPMTATTTSPSYRHAERQDADAIEAFDEIINQMPESDAAFNIAKEAILSRLRTDRTTGVDVLNSYLPCAVWALGGSQPAGFRTGADHDARRREGHVAEGGSRIAPTPTGILGDIKNLDLNFLKTLGPIRTVSQEEIFGY